MKKTIYIPLIFIIGIVCLLFGYLVLSNVADIDTVDSKVQMGSLVLDSNDKPHVVYSTIEEGLKYAVKDNEEWNFETINSVGYFPSLRLDSNGKPHLIFMVFDEIAFNYSLKYAFKNQGSWNIETIDTSYYASLALDSNNKPHVVYGYGDDKIMYAYKNDGIWSKEVAATLDIESTIIASSLAFNSEDEPHIAYGDSVSQVVMYVFKSGESWQNETVKIESDWAIGIGNYISLAMDAAGNPHICYYHSDPGLSYAIRSNGEWDIEIVDSENGGSGCSLIVDSEGNPNISYNDDDLFLRYAYKTDGRWIVKRIDPNTLSTSLDIDSEDNQHIIYSFYGVAGDPSNIELKYFVGSKVSGILRFIPTSPIVAYASFGVGIIIIISGALYVIRGTKTRR